jgi:hypothetical protein
LNRWLIPLNTSAKKCAAMRKGLNVSCVRCEIVRAKLRVFWLFNVGYGADEIVFDLNGRYSGCYSYTLTPDKLTIIRKPVPSPYGDGVVIAEFNQPEPNLNDAI